MKVTMTFKMPEDSDELKVAQKGGAYLSALQDIAEELFRPARKHGYPNQTICDALKKCEIGGEEGAGEDLIGLLEQEFFEILRSHEVLLMP